MKSVQLFKALPSGARRLTKRELRMVAAGIGAARSANADVGAVLTALGVSSGGIWFAKHTKGRPDLAELLIAALARVPRGRRAAR